MPKRLSHLEIWVTIWFAGFLQCLADAVFDLGFNLYGYFAKGFQWESLIVVFGIFPAVSTIFLNYYPFNGKTSMKIHYIVGWTAFSIMFEIASVKSGYFYYDGWKWWYSASCYPVLLYILVWDLKVIRKLNAERR